MYTKTVYPDGTETVTAFCDWERRFRWRTLRFEMGRYAYLRVNHLVYSRRWLWNIA